MSTPARAQYLNVKKNHPDALLLYRLGDFYELFDDDARLAAQELGLTLTKRQFARDEVVPMAGVPHHSVDTYIGRLIERGYKVAICEQMSDPREGKGIVDREVVRVVTPGTVTNTEQIVAQRNNYLAAVLLQQGQAGLAYVDVTTGEFITSQLRGEPTAVLVERELARINPAECLWPAAQRPRSPVPGSGSDIPPVTVSNCVMTPYDLRAFSLAQASALLRQHYQLATLDSQPWGGLPLAIAAAGALLAYVRDTQRSLAPQIRPLTLYASEQFMALDAATRRNLELTRSLGHDGAEGSLISVLDRTKTAPGARLLRRWLAEPLAQMPPLLVRQDAVGALLEQVAHRLAVLEALTGMGDLERLTGRVLQGTASPKELRALHDTLRRVQALRSAVQSLAPTPAVLSDGPSLALSLAQIALALDPCPDLCVAIDACLVDDPPANAADGGIVRPGYSAALDDIVESARDARTWVAALEASEKERTGIRSLKVGYNKVFGYYIEVSHANTTLIPTDYVRKQTLVGAERYITPALKERETLILSAHERSVKLELQLLADLRTRIATAGPRLLRTADAIAQADVYTALATVAAQQRYTRPQFVADDAACIEIVAGRHPVVEVTQRDIAFVPNDATLHGQTQQIIVLTGPNMAGKSTWLRQIALIVLMAQVGSFVPADCVRMTLCDRIFTRVGAQDDIATGRSTFMVEMVETAAILQAMSRRSLVVLDEVGRGTSTYDGVSIAQSVVEYLHNSPRAHPLTVFATHYHELTALAAQLPRVRNFRMDVLEEGTQVVFLRRVVEGGADRSYGIYVAELAGLPAPVIRRARQILHQLEERAGHAQGGRRASHLPALSLFDVPTAPEPTLVVPSPSILAQRALCADLAAIDPANLTPLQAMHILFDLQARAHLLPPALE